MAEEFAKGGKMAQKAKKGLNIPIEELSSRIKNTDFNSYFIFGAIILVLVVGLYALFSSDAQNARLGNPACGKIVVATEGPSLVSNVSPSLSEAKYFLVVNPLSKKLLETIRNPYRSTVPNPQIAYLIAGKGEEAVIVGNIDQQSYNILMQFGIRVFGGYQGRAQSAIKLYRQARISASSTPTDTLVQSPMGAQESVVAQQGIAQVGFGRQGMCPFICPQCRRMTNYSGATGMCPICPNCRIQMVQQNIDTTQGATAANWGMQNMNGMGIMNNPYCQFPAAQQNMDTTTQGVATPANWGTQNCPLPVNIAGATAAATGNQGFLGLGQQAFICPNCNWRLKCARQGNSFPNCPNCGSAMATDMSSANKGWNLWPDGQWANGQQAANTATQQAANMAQPNFWQGPESTGFFICPNCNWRMYSQNGINDGYPQCPNCKALMARAGVYPQNQVNNTVGAAQVALQSTTNVSAPPIFRDAVMPHSYRGVCENCHIVRADIPIAANAQMPHPYRGVCSNCHKILGTQAGAQQVQTINNLQAQNTQAVVSSNDVQRAVIK